MRQIDQLDIAAHQSFKELLEAENILVQFGLEDAEDDARAASERIKAAAQSANTGTAAVSSTQVSSTATPDAQVAPSATTPMTYDTSGKTTPSSANTGAAAPALFGDVGFTSIGESGIQDDGTQGQLGYEYVERNPSFADVSYFFSCTTISLSNPVIDLSRIDPKKIDEAASRITSTGDVLLRKEIVSTLGKRLRTVDTKSAEVDSLSVSDEDVAMALLRLVMNEKLLSVTEENKRIAKSFLVKRFMENAPVDHLTVKSLDSATGELRGLVHEFVDDALRSRTEETKIVPFKMPSLDRLTVPLGEHVHESRSRRKTSLCAIGSTTVGSSRFLRRSRLIPTQENICWQGFSTPRLILRGDKGCILRSTPTSTTTPRIATCLTLSQWTTSMSTGLSRARMLAGVTTRPSSQSAGRRSPWQ